MHLATRGTKNEWIDCAHLDSDWDRCLTQFMGGPPETHRAMLRPFACLRDEYIETMRTVPDRAERDTVCAAFFILLKSYWILLTTRSGYRISTGQSDNRLVCRASLFAALLAQVEKNLPADQADRISAVLARPLEVQTKDRRATVHDTDVTFSDTVPGRFANDSTGFGGSEPPFTRREEQLIAVFRDQQAELQGLREGKALLEQVFGTDRATEICEIFAEARATTSRLMAEIEQCQGVPGRTPAQVRHQLTILQERVAALERERAGYRARDERLRAEIGTDDVDAIATRFHGKDAGGPGLQNELHRMLDTVERSLKFAA